MPAQHPRIAWRRLQEEAAAVARGGGSVAALAAALRTAQSGRYFDADKGARKDGRALAKLAERYGRETERCRAELRGVLGDAAARVAARIDAATPHARYRADIDG